MEAEQGVSTGLGITIDQDNEVVILVAITAADERTYVVSMPPDVALHFGRTIRDLSRDAQRLQDELDDLDPEEITDRLVAIRTRHAG